MVLSKENKHYSLGLRKELRMLTLAFFIGLIWMIWKIAIVGIKLTWGLIKFMFSVVLFPLAIVGIFFTGLVYIALPIVIVVGLVALIAGKVVAA